MAEKYLTKKDLRNLTKCSGHLIDYLFECNRLPVAKESQGHGYPRLYKPEAVQVVKDHVEKRSR